MYRKFRTVMSPSPLTVCRHSFKFVLEIPFYGSSSWVGGSVPRVYSSRIDTQIWISEKWSVVESEEWLKSLVCIVTRVYNGLTDLKFPYLNWSKFWKRISVPKSAKNFIRNLNYISFERIRAETWIIRGRIEQIWILKTLHSSCFRNGRRQTDNWW